MVMGKGKEHEGTAQCYPTENEGSNYVALLL